MRKISIASIIGMVLLLTFLVDDKALAQVGAVQGTVLSKHGKPIPGVTVSLVSRKAGRSRIQITDRWGKFMVPNIPLHVIAPIRSYS